MMTTSIDFVNEEILKEIAFAQVKQVYNWEELKKVLGFKLSTIPSELVQCDSKGMVQKCMKQLDQLIETPFTVQRICELILMLDSIQKNSNETTDSESSLKPQIKVQYKNFEKFINAVYKCLNVTGKCDDNSLSPSVHIMDTS